MRHPFVGSVKEFGRDLVEIFVNRFGSSPNGVVLLHLHMLPSSIWLPRLFLDYVRFSFTMRAPPSLVPRFLYHSHKLSKLKHPRKTVSWFGHKAKNVMNSQNYDHA